MRLWSLNPRHLDARGLTALWREGLLARAVLAGATRGYRHHPQLERFRARRDPLAALDCYLSRVLDEARGRGYRFDESKIRYRRCRAEHTRVTAGQLLHEWAHLLGKLAARDPARWEAERRSRPVPHGCFRVVPGPAAAWERGFHDHRFHATVLRCHDQVRKGRRIHGRQETGRLREPGRGAHFPEAGARHRAAATTHPGKGGEPHARHGRERGAGFRGHRLS